MRTALVTGGTGLVGSHVVERLLDDGWQVRVLVRNSGRAGWLGRRGAEAHAGDVLDVPSFARAAAQCDLVVHAAAAIFHGDGWAGYERTNVQGARNAVDAARRAGARLVHVSSVAVYGDAARYQAGGARTDEDGPLAPLAEEALYARSKRESEAVVLEAHANGGVWATAVRPSVIYGRRDRQFVPRMARLIEHGLVPLVNRGRTTMALVHAANVADGIVRAAATGAAGGRAYNLADDFPVTVERFFRMGAAAMDARPRFVGVPLPLARLGASLADAVMPRLGFDRSVASARSSLDYVTRDNPFTSERAREELGWSPQVRPEDGVPDAFRWWRENH